MSFDYLGEAGSVRLEQQDVIESNTPYGFHQIDIEESTEWETITIDLADFEQPSWVDDADQYDLDLEQIVAISWQVSSDEDAQGVITIDNVQCQGVTAP